MVQHLRTAALVAAASLALAACGTSSADETDGSTPAAAGSVTVEDNNGKQTISSPKSVVATDNRTFETLDAWGVKLTAGAVSLMPDTIGYAKDKSVVDLGSHREPNLEAVVAVAPDLIINGQRFTQFEKDFKKLAPEATVLALDPREGKPLLDELKRQTTVLGEVFGKQDEAAKLGADLDAAIERVKKAYDPSAKVMAVNTSGGEIGYIAPGVGRTLGPLFDAFSMTPALKVEGSSNKDTGDDISVEAIAKSNPDWILVMDRDAALATAQEAGYKPANELLKSSAALKGVTAVKEDNLVYMPKDTYTNEGIQTYTEFLNTFADALEAKQS